MYTIKELGSMSGADRGAYFLTLRQSVDEIKAAEESCVSLASKGVEFDGFKFNGGRENIVWLDTSKALIEIQHLVTDLKEVMSLNSPRKVFEYVGNQNRGTLEPFIERKYGSPYLRQLAEK